MPYARYLGFEGTCSVVLGLALAVAAAPGVVLHYGGAGWWVLLVPALLVALAAFAHLRRGVGWLDVGGWLTAGPLQTASADEAPLPPGPLRRRLLVETAIWIVAVDLWVVLGASDGGFIFGTGLASLAYGLVQAVASRGRVLREEQHRGARFLIAERPGLGLPRLTTA